MRRMRRLTIIVAGADAARFRAGLETAAAWAALGRPVRLFLQGEAVRLLTRSGEAPADAEHRAAGSPGLSELIEEARALGVELIACQSGAGLAGVAIDSLGNGVTGGGLVSLLADAGEDQIVMV